MVFVFTQERLLTWTENTWYSLRDAELIETFTLTIYAILDNYLAQQSQIFQWVDGIIVTQIHFDPGIVFMRQTCFPLFIYHTKKLATFERFAAASTQTN